MLAVVKAPRTRNTKAACFSIQGNVPDFVMKFICKKFADVQIIDLDDQNTKDEELISWDNSKLDDKFKKMTTPAESLKLLRTTFKMTQKELSQKTGVAVQAISAMECGRAPIGRKMAHKLADALGTSYKNLFW